MPFTSNEYKIVRILNYTEFIAANEIADKMYVSPKTIYRLVKKINNNVEEKYSDSLIITEAGKGMKLNKKFLGKQIDLIEEDDNNLNNIILKLLFEFPKKLNKKSLFKSEFISESTLYRTTEKIEEMLLNNNIKLMKSDQYIWLSGSENNIRDAIKNIFSKINKDALLGKLDFMSNDNDRYFIDKQIKLAEKKMGKEITYPYIINLYTHIYMVIERYRNGDVDIIGNQEPLSNDEKELIRNNKFLYDIANQIGDNISSYMSKTLVGMESVFIFQHLYSFQSEHVKYSDTYIELAKLITRIYIENYYNEGIVDYKNKEISKDLYHHILSMLYRLKVGIPIENVMLADIKTEYKQSFNKVFNITKKINQKLVELDFKSKISEEDIGFIVLYFEKYNIIQSPKLSVIVVCSTGVGTSELIKAKLTKKFREIKVLKTASQRNIENVFQSTEDNVDAIISTIHIDSKKINVPIINISPLLTENDMYLINKLLKENTNDRN